MPSSFICLGILLFTVVIWFSVFKRPVYKAIILSFLILLTVTGNRGNLGSYIETGLTTNLI